MVNEIGPEINYAINDATAPTKNIFKDQKIVSEIISELKKEKDDSILPSEFIQFLLDHVEADKSISNPGKNSLFTRIKKLLPPKLKNLLRNSIASPKLDYNLMAFRAYILIKMNKLLLTDSKAYI